MASQAKAEGTFLTGVNIETGQPVVDGQQVVPVTSPASSSQVSCLSLLVVFVPRP